MILNILWEALLLKLKFQYFGQLMLRTDSLEKTLMLGKIEGKRRKERQRMRWLDSIIHSMDMNMRKLQETVEEEDSGMLQFTWSQTIRHNLSSEQQKQQ